MIGTETAAPGGAAGIDQPYPPGWADRFADWVERLPIPAWVFYLLVWAVGVLSLVGFQLAHSGRAAVPNLLYVVFFASQPTISLGMSHAIRSASGRSFDRFRSLLPGDDQEASRHKYSMMVAPARPTLVASFVMALVMPFVMMNSDASQPLRLNVQTPTAIAILSVWLLVMWFLLGGTLYHLVYQLTAIRRLLAVIPQVDLNDPEPAYAFSSTTAMAAVLLTLNNYLWYSTQPALLSDPFSIAAGLIMAGLALVVFIWPLWGVHSLLQREKARRLAANGHAFEGLAEELHDRSQRPPLEGMGELHHALSALEIERGRLARAPTWPWHPGTFRGTLTAILLPIAIWMIQQILSRWL